MKKNTPTIYLIACVILAAALLVSVIALVSAQSQVKELKAQVQSLQGQLSVDQSYVVPARPEDYYCNLVVDTWSVASDTLTVDAYAQAALSVNVAATAQLELRLGDTVLQTIALELEAGEAAGMHEADITNAAFAIPSLGADDELQLWLTVCPENGEPFSTCGAGWYPEDGQLMLITG